jgi:hypothetical protein
LEVASVVIEVVIGEDEEGVVLVEELQEAVGALHEEAGAAENLVLEEEQKLSL